MTSHFGARSSANHWFEPLSVAWSHAWWAEDPSWAKPADGGAVSSWRNAGTQAIAATQATGASQPLYRAAYAALNSQPAVEFDGTDDFLDTTGTTALAQPNHIVIVGYLSASAVDPSTPLDTVTSTNRHLMRQRVSTGAIQMYAGTDWQFGTGASFGSAFIMIGLFNGATSECRLNGIQYDAASLAGNVGANTFQNPRIGRDTSTGTGYFKGALAFVGVKDTALTAQEITDLEAWARSIYGVITPISNPGQVTGLKQWLDASDATSIFADLNFLNFPATSGIISQNNYVSVPHAADQVITGDITVQAHVYLTQWPGPGRECTFIAKAKSDSTASPSPILDTSWTFGLADNGTLVFTWTTDGNTPKSVYSTVAPTITNGPWQWVGIGFDVDNGSGGYTAKFWKADDVTLTWTQVGTTVTVATGITSIFGGTADLMINGWMHQGSHQHSYAGRADQVTIAAGVNAGLDPNGGTVKFRMFQHDVPSNSNSTFKCWSGHTATINRGGNPATSTIAYSFPKSKIFMWNDKSGNGYHLSQSTQDAKPWDGQTTLNGRKTVMFEGMHMMRYTGSTALNVGNATVFVVAGQDQATEGVGFFVAHHTGVSSDWSSSAAFAMTSGTSSTYLQVERYWQADGVGQAKIAGTGSAPYSVWVTQMASTGLIQAWRNGGVAAQSTRAATFGTAGGGFLVGARFQGGAVDTLYRLVGQIGEIVVYDRALTLPEIDLVGRYLAGRWGFTWTTAT